MALSRQASEWLVYNVPIVKAFIPIDPVRDAECRRLNHPSNKAVTSYGQFTHYIRVPIFAYVLMGTLFYES